MAGIFFKASARRIPRLQVIHTSYLHYQAIYAGHLETH